MMNVTFKDDYLDVTLNLPVRVDFPPENEMKSTKETTSWRLRVGLQLDIKTTSPDNRRLTRMKSGFSYTMRP